MRKTKSDLSVDGNITISGTPTNPDHVATKDYVDSATPPVPPQDSESGIIASRVFM
jgi:hypothetical protein